MVAATLRGEQWLNALRAAQHAVSRQEYRPILNTFCIDLHAPKDGLVGRVCAADNYRLVVVGLRGEEGTEVEPGQLLLPLATYPMVRAFLHQYRARQTRVSLDEGYVRFATLLGGEADTLRVRGLDGHYPNIEAAVVEQAEQTSQQRVAMDGKFLPYWNNRSKEDANGSVVVRFGGPHDVIVIERDLYREYVMPVRTGTIPGQQPDWARISGQEP